MRLWHYKLIPYLPKQMLVSQWRECIAIKRQWEKGTLKHRLVSYVKNYDKRYFYSYVRDLMLYLKNKNIKYKHKYEIEMYDFGEKDFEINDIMKQFYYSEHNDRYLKQCLYNLQEKADRGIVSKEEWKIIEDKFGEYLGG